LTRTSKARTWKFTAQAVTFLINTAIGLTLLSGGTGCRLFDPTISSDEEYNRAKRQIESPPEDDEDWVRPEGESVEKRKEGALPILDKLFRWDKAKNPDLAKKLYNEADIKFNEAKSLEGYERLVAFRAAAKKYKEAGKNWRNSYLEQDSLYMEGRSYFFAEDYPKAEDAFTRLVKEYPRTKYLDSTQKHRFEVAQYWVQYNQVAPASFYNLNWSDNKRPINDTGGHGRRVLEKMRLDDPTGVLADDVTMALANEAFQRGDFETAAETYEDLRLTYPDSKHQFEAHFLELRSLIEIYQGPEYSSEPMDRAEKLIKQINRQFARQADEQREYLSQAYAEVRYKQGERRWMQAEYRRKRGENKSARMYLQEILDGYEDTPFGEQAKERLAELEGAQDDPTQYLSWLTQLFPDADPAKPLIDSRSSSP
jgi:TolA-binding protein